MRCDCCNKRLTDYEATLKSLEFGCYMNTCVKCLKGLDIAVVGREDLAPQFQEDASDEDAFDVEGEDYYRDISHLMYDDPIEDK